MISDVDIINEVMSLLLEVKSGWEGIRESYEKMEGQGKLADKPVTGGRISV